ncbi:hypothetical protein ACFXKI_53725 [Streptomyces mirabilis]|uniref:hypothetical protein n=1 Tax=Streptomyces mirabilis TaxID=68239 RepID=UPI003677593B
MSGSMCSSCSRLLGVSISGGMPCRRSGVAVRAGEFPEFGLAAPPVRVTAEAQSGEFGDPQVRQVPAVPPR